MWDEHVHVLLGYYRILLPFPDPHPAKTVKEKIQKFAAYRLAPRGSEEHNTRSQPHHTKPSREDGMLSDTGITIAGHTITSLQFLGAGALLLGVAALLLAFTRERRTSLKRSTVTDELAIHLGRIADALDRIANQPSERAMWRASRQRAEASPSRPAGPAVESPETHGVSYSMFGR